MTFEETVTQGAAELGAALPEGAAEKFERFFRILSKKNEEMNLTAITGEEDAARLHFLDSLALTRAYDMSGRRVADVGTGGGFPGVPLAIAVPSARITLMDATGKKIDFLREACGELGVAADFAAVRAEEAGRGEFREAFGAAVARAVSRLNILCELCLPLVRPGGAFIAMKSADTDAEIAEAAAAIRVLGGSGPRIFSYRIPGTDIERRAVVIEKLSPTPAKYPRRWAVIKKSPL